MQAELPEVQHSGHIVSKDVVHLVLRIDVLVTPVHDFLPPASHHLQTEPHIGTVSLKVWGTPKTGFRNSELELN